MQKALIALFIWLGTAVAVQAETPLARIDALAEALGLPEILDVMRQEGLQNGAELAEEMFPERADESWDEMVGTIYDPGWMDETVRGRFAAELDGTDIAPLTEFFTSETGRKIVALEVSARQALLDDAVEEAGKERLQDMRLDGDPLLDQVQEYIAINELLEYNVVGAMNSNYAFYTGMQAGGAFDATLTEDQILTDVWSQEDVIRADTEEWLYAFLTMAYQPLSEDEMQAYIDLSRSPEGQDLNRALFAAFDKLFVDVSHALGQSAAVFVAGEDL